MSSPAARWRHRLLQAGIVVSILAILGGLLAVAAEVGWETADRIHCNLGGVRHAMYGYQGSHGGLPPAILYGKDGTPLHSWRVLLLPFIEEEALFNEFRLDEPWDSPHNRALLPRMPRSYAAPGSKASRIPPYHTALHVFVGKGTAFEERSGPMGTVGSEQGTVGSFKPAIGLKIPDDFPDGTENTLLFVEAGEPVPWTKPQELPYDPDRPLPELQGLFRAGFRACTVAGPYRFIRKDTPEETLRALISRNGGDNLGLDQ
jgi:hypothetical protein